MLDMFHKTIHFFFLGMDSKKYNKERNVGERT